MNLDIWNSLSEDQQQYVKSVSSRFIQAVCSSKARDRFDFYQMYSVQKRSDVYVISDGVQEIGGVEYHEQDNALNQIPRPGLRKFSCFD